MECDGPKKSVNRIEPTQARGTKEAGANRANSLESREQREGAALLKFDEVDLLRMEVAKAEMEALRLLRELEESVVDIEERYFDHSIEE